MYMMCSVGPVVVSIHQYNHAITSAKGCNLLYSTSFRRLKRPWAHFDNAKVVFDKGKK